MPLGKPFSLLSGAAVAFVGIAIVACTGGDEPALEQEVIGLSIELGSNAFTEGSGIPTKYTCAGEDVSHTLSWSGVPEGAKSLALIVDDPDARGTWVHWVLYSLPPDITRLPEGVPATSSTSEGATNGTNDFNRVGYGGPCPPGGAPHRYFFKLYALDNKPDLQPGATKAQLIKTIDGHILAEGQLMGTYKRQ